MACYIGKKVYIYNENGVVLTGKITKTVDNGKKFRVEYKDIEGHKHIDDSYDFYPDEVGLCVFFSKEDMPKYKL